MDSDRSESLFLCVCVFHSFVSRWFASLEYFSLLHLNSFCIRDLIHKSGTSRTTVRTVGIYIPIVSHTAKSVTANRKQVQQWHGLTNTQNPMVISTRTFTCEQSTMNKTSIGRLVDFELVCCPTKPIQSRGFTRWNPKPFFGDSK